LTAQSAKERPFHILDNEFYDIIGADPTLTLIAETDGDPLFHEANVWYPPTDEMFFVQAAGPAAGESRVGGGGNGVEYLLWLESEGGGPLKG
jgi:gluconolactonase